MELETDFDKALASVYDNEGSLLRELAELLITFGSICMYSPTELLLLKIERKWIRFYVSDDFGNSFYCLGIGRVSRLARKRLDFYEFEIARARAHFALNNNIELLRGYGVPFFDDLKLQKELGYRMAS